jgi:N utilization substance protein A
VAKPTLLTARTEFASALNQICTERGIEPKVVLETIKAAILAAYRKDTSSISKEDEHKVEVNSDTGGAKIFKVDGKKKKDVTPPGFGRIAAQTAKQVILQKIREAEKDSIIQDYQDKINTIVSGMILRWQGRNIIADIGRGQGLMPPQEQVKDERYSLNKRMNFYIVDIRETMRGKQIIISRTASQLVKGLFEREVPEVSSGAVAIKEIAREPGNRSKVAVVSTQPGVDPVGSCVGQKGVRVQAVIEELNGEKIDIVQFSDDIKKFMAAALAPAENVKIETNEKKKQATVTVPEDQLSLAIGREGQNVRLAAKLTGYKIDIKGPQGKKVKVQDTNIKTLKLTKKIIGILEKAGINEIGKLENLGKEGLKEIEDLTEKNIKTILKKLKKYQEEREKIKEKVAKVKKVAKVAKGKNSKTKKKMKKDKKEKAKKEKKVKK